jgi:hypothetical protein
MPAFRSVRQAGRVSSLKSGEEPSRSAYPGERAAEPPAGLTTAGPADETAPATPGRSCDRLTRALAWTAAICIPVSALVVIVVSAAGPSLAVVTLPRSAAGPPWWLSLHPSPGWLTFVLWAATAVGGSGVIAGLAAVARGARPSVRGILTFSFLAVAVLTVLPPAGSTDILDYAANGRMVATGHSPYVMTPLQLKRTGDPVGQWVPQPWETDVSLYGPVASAEEWTAAELGGTSMTRIVFWLKLFNSIAFGAVALMLDRLLRSNRARRLRAHLLWTANPLLWWEIVASGHIDGLSAAFGLLGIVLLRTGRDGERPALQRFLLAGLFVGVAAAIKIPYAVFGVGVAWAGRKSLTSLASAAAGFLLIFAPAYAIAGHPAVSVLISRGPGTAWDTMYQVFYRPFGYLSFTAFSVPPYLTLVSAVCLVTVAVLMFLRFPDATPALPALSLALALSLAWLFFWSYQRPWYDVMAICLLAAYPASNLDWVVLVRLIVTAPVYIPGMPVIVGPPAAGGNTPGWLNNVFVFEGIYISAYGRLVAAVALVALCVFGWWGWQRDRSGTLAGGVPVPRSLVLTRRDTRRDVPVAAVVRPRRLPDYRDPPPGRRRRRTPGRCGRAGPRPGAAGRGAGGGVPRRPGGGVRLDPAPGRR